MDDDEHHTGDPEGEPCGGPKGDPEGEPCGDPEGDPEPELGGFIGDPGEEDPFGDQVEDPEGDVCKKSSCMEQDSALVGRNGLVQREVEQAKQDPSEKAREDQDVRQSVRDYQQARQKRAPAAKLSERLSKPVRSPVEQRKPPESRLMVAPTQIAERARCHPSSTVLKSIFESAWLCGSSVVTG